MKTHLDFHQLNLIYIYIAVISGSLTLVQLQARASTLMYFDRVYIQGLSFWVKLKKIDSFLLNGDFCHLLITFANSLDPD